MANFTKQFQDEVRRLTRKETKDDIAKLHKENTELRRTLAQIKRRLIALEQKSTKIARKVVLAEDEPATPEDAQTAAAERARISAKTVRTLRQKLGLTQAEFAKLLGVSGQSVYQWERQDGRLQLRRATRRAIHEAKAMGVREARARLQELG